MNQKSVKNVKQLKIDYPSQIDQFAKKNDRKKKFENFEINIFFEINFILFFDAKILAKQNTFFTKKKVEII